MKLPMPSANKLTEWDGRQYVKCKGGPLPLDTWRVREYLQSLDEADLLVLVKLVAAPMPVWMGLSTYNCPNTKSGYLTYLYCCDYKWLEVGLTVEALEAAE